MVATLRFALALSFALIACSGSPDDGTGPIVDDVGSVVKVAGESAELRVTVSFHHPENETITQYSFVPRGNAPKWRDFPSDVKGSEGNQVTLTVDANDVRQGTHAFDLILRDDRGRAGPHHRVTFTVVE